MTSEIGFIECDAERAADAYCQWQAPIQQQRGVELHRGAVDGELKAILQALLPLTSVESRRTAFVPTASTWAAVFDNGWRGTDAQSLVSYLCRLIGCRGVRAVWIPSEPARGAAGRSGAVIFELYAGRSTQFLNVERSIAVVRDGGRWAFHAAGTQQLFEQTQLYESRVVRQRFPAVALAAYLGALGIRAFDPSFYSSPTSAWLVSKAGAVAPGLREYSLHEARSALGLVE